MQVLLSGISENFDTAMKVLAGVSTVVSILAIGATTLSMWRNRRVSFTIGELEFTPQDPGSASPSLVARNRVVTHITEAKSYREGQLGSAKWSKLSSNLLIIGQYIIGGVLASSFIQESLNPKWVGALGVLVLIASLVRQQFHPELNADSSKRKAARTQALIRSSEDQLAILDTKIAGGQDHTAEMIALMTQITEMLSEIENPEALAATSRSSAA